MYLNKSLAEKRLADLFMDDLPIIEWTVAPSTISSDWFPKYKKLRIEFMKSLTNSIEELSFMNFSSDEFMGLITGRKMPENTSIRFRIPLFYGGEMTIENMFLCRTFSNSHNMDRFIIEQNCSDKIWLPAPVKNVYCPVHTAGGGGGGNASDDRISQFSAQLSSSRGME